MLMLLASSPDVVNVNLCSAIFFLFPFVPAWHWHFLAGSVYIAVTIAPTITATAILVSILVSIVPVVV